MGHSTPRIFLLVHPRIEPSKLLRSLDFRSVAVLGTSPSCEHATITTCIESTEFQSYDQCANIWCSLDPELVLRKAKGVYDLQAKRAGLPA